MKSFMNFATGNENVKLDEAGFSDTTRRLMKLIFNKVITYGVRLVDSRPKIDYEDDENFRAEVWFGNLNLLGGVALMSVDSFISDNPTSKNKSSLVITVNNKIVIKESNTKNSDNGVDLSDEVLTKVVKEILYALGIKVK